MKTGIVIKNTGSLFYVKEKCDETVYTCRIKGKFRIKGIRSTNPVSIGDIVDFDVSDKSNVITKIHPRKNYIIRKSSNLSMESQIMASNIDLAVIMITIKYPVTLTQFIDRFLVSVQAYSIPAVLLFNKTDIYTSQKEKEKLRNYISGYRLANYNCIEISAKEGENIETVKNLLKDKITIISGHSGVGKSTLLNILNPSLNLKVQEISQYHQSGKHTTSYYEMYPLPFGGYR